MSSAATSSVFERQNQRLIEQSIEMARMAGALAHEIKNPLSVIRLNMDLLAEDLAQGDSPRDRRALAKVATVQAQCQRLEQLLEDFLAFARAQKLELEPGDLNDVVTEAVDFLRPRLEEAGVRVTTFLRPDLASVPMDRQKLHAALLNLLLNAMQAMPGRHPRAWPWT
jgi:signal transduction histidine kinase